MIKYSDDLSEGCTVDIVAGPHKGKQGIVKTASEGILEVHLPNGQDLAVDEDAVKVKIPAFEPVSE